MACQILKIVVLSIENIAADSAVSSNIAPAIIDYFLKTAHHEVLYSLLLVTHYPVNVSAELRKFQHSNHICSVVAAFY